jgi:hypothetical protein
VFGAPQHRVSANNENTPQVAVALLGDRSELLFATARVLSRHQPDPGCKIAPRTERLQIRYNGRNGGRTNKAHPGNGPKPLARLVDPMLRYDPLLD